MPRAQSLLAYHHRPLLLMLWRRCACERANESETPYFIFFFQASTSSSSSWLPASVSPPSRGIWWRRHGNLPLFCCCKDKHRRIRGWVPLCFPHHKTVPRWCLGGKHFFLLSFCNFPSTNKYMKSSNIIDVLLFHCQLSSTLDPHACVSLYFWNVMKSPNGCSLVSFNGHFLP